MRYHRSSSTATTPVGDRVVLYENRSRKAVVLNPTGAWLWQALSTPRSADELSEQLHSRFPNTAADQIRQDVETCLRELVNHELLYQEP